LLTNDHNSSKSRFYWYVLKESIARFFKYDVPTRSAALSFYMVFSLPPMLLIIVWTAAGFYREVAVREAIFFEIGKLVGREGAGELMATIERINIQEPNWWATALGIGVLLFTATTVLVTIRDALNRIFQVKPPESTALSIWQVVRDRFVSIAFLVTITFILLVSLVVDALITAFGNFLANRIGVVTPYLRIFDSVLFDLGAAVILFTLLFRFLPDAKLNWKDAWFGALVTTALFTVGKYLIGYFIGKSEVADIYAAAGSFLVMMLWVYYTSAIFLFGATITFTRSRLLQDGIVQR
jgi:membrane protein